MNPNQYFFDLSRELRAVQNRIRNLIGDAHWPSDGAWKESVLRAVVRRYLPPSYTVGSGFIVTEDDVSTQIDILICNDAAPILFRDGDFIISTADCVRAAIEVKTKLTPAELLKTIQGLDGISKILRRHCIHPRPFLGLFCYEPTTAKPQTVFDALKSFNGRTSDYPIRAMCFGDSQYYRYWEHNPQQKARRPYDSWHAYDLPEKAVGYFIHNLVEYLFPNAVERAELMWYPAQGKEGQLIASKGRKDG